MYYLHIIDLTEPDGDGPLVLEKHADEKLTYGHAVWFNTIEEMVVVSKLIHNGLINISNYTASGLASAIREALA